MYAELVFPAGTTIPEMTRDVVRVITTSDGAGAANNSILEFADNVNSNIVDTVASEWSLDPAFTLATGAAGTSDQRYMVQQAHQNGATKTVMIGSYQQNPSYISTSTHDMGLSMGMVWNRGAADPAYETYSHFTGGLSTWTTADYQDYTHTTSDTEDKTLVIWAQPRSIGMIANHSQTSGNVTEAGIIAIVENVDTYESKWRGVAQPQQALFLDYYSPLKTPLGSSSTMANSYLYILNSTTTSNYPLIPYYRKPQIYFQNTFWDKYSDRFMVLTYWHQYPRYTYAASSSTYYNDDADTFGYWYKDETESLGLNGLTYTTGRQVASYPRIGAAYDTNFWIGSTASFWSSDGGSIIYGNRSFHNNWQYHTPTDANGDPAVQLTPVVYRVGSEARYQDYSSEAGFYFSTPNFKDSEHMYYKFLTDNAGDTFLMFYSDFTYTDTAGGYAIKVS
ncbi:MAG: hypothetical protein VW443_02440 [Pseudomonadales bacterium]